MAVLISVTPLTIRAILLQIDTIRSNDRRDLKDKFVLVRRRDQSELNYGFISGDNEVNARRGTSLTGIHTLRFINKVSEVKHFIRIMF